jgi:hypothetical protein
MITYIIDIYPANVKVIVLDKQSPRLSIQKSYKKNVWFQQLPLIEC